MSTRRGDLPARDGFLRMHGLESCYRPSRREQIVNCGTDQPWGNNPISTSGSECRTRHSINYRARTILNDRSTTRGSNRTESIRSVASHSSKNYTHHILSKYLSRTFKQRIGRRTDAAHQRARISVNYCAASSRHDGHVTVARSEIHSSSKYLLIIPADIDRERAQLRQSSRERCKKIG